MFLLHWYLCNSSKPPGGKSDRTNILFDPLQKHRVLAMETSQLDLWVWGHHGEIYIFCFRNSIKKWGIFGYSSVPSPGVGWLIREYWSLFFFLTSNLLTFCNFTICLTICVQFANVALNDIVQNLIFIKCYCLYL